MNGPRPPESSNGTAWGLSEALREHTPNRLVVADSSPTHQALDLDDDGEVTAAPDGERYY